MCVFHILLHNTFGRVVATFPAVVYVDGPNFPGLSPFPFKLEEHIIFKAETRTCSPNPEQAHTVAQAHSLSIEHDQERDIIVVAVLDA